MVKQGFCFFYEKLKIERVIPKGITGKSLTLLFLSGGNYV